MPVVFGLIKVIVVSGILSAMIFVKVIRQNGQKRLNKFAGEDLKSCSRRIDPYVENFASQPKLTYSTPDSIKQNFKAITKKAVAGNDD